MFDRFKKDKELKIEFWCPIPGLTHIPEIVPHKTTPDWWRDIEYKPNNIKVCPSFPQVFSTGYVIPMWMDIDFFNDGNSVKFSAAAPIAHLKPTFHPNFQFLDHAPDYVKDKFDAVVKLICPWEVRTPKGYSVFQMPTYWDFQSGYSVAQGIINTDYFTQINQQLLISCKPGETVSIRRGDPLAIYFPFKRDKFSFEVREATEEDKRLTNKTPFIARSKFVHGYNDHLKYLEKNGLV